MARREWQEGGTTLPTSGITEVSSTPVFATVRRITADYGLSKATVHRKLTEKKIRGKKAGRITLVEVRSLIEYLASLPDR